MTPSAPKPCSPPPRGARLGAFGLAALAVFALCACSDDDLPATSAPRTLSLPLAASVGSEAFACGKTYTIGKDGAQFEPTDLRFYVSDPVGVLADGRRVSLRFVPDVRFASERVALLDFEDATGACSNGTPELNRELKLSLPAEKLALLELTLGVPFELNHRDVTTAAAPLDVSPLFWSWQGGYKFLRADGKVTRGEVTTNWNTHLGSTGCDGSERGDVTRCAAENRVVLRFSNVEAAGATLRFDLAALLADSQLAVNTEKTPPGCMSSPTDPECGPIFSALGLPWGDAPSGEARVFTLQLAAP